MQNCCRDSAFALWAGIEEQRSLTKFIRVNSRCGNFGNLQLVDALAPCLLTGCMLADLAPFFRISTGPANSMLNNSVFKLALAKTMFSLGSRLIFLEQGEASICQISFKIGITATGVVIYRLR